MKNRSAKAASEIALVISILLWLLAALTMFAMKDTVLAKHQIIVTGIMVVTAVVAGAFTTSIKPIRNGARSRTIVMMTIGGVIAAALWVLLVLAGIDTIRADPAPVLYAALLLVALPAAMFSAFAWHCARSLSLIASQKGQRGFAAVTTEPLSPSRPSDLPSTTDERCEPEPATGMR